MKKYITFIILLAIVPALLVSCNKESAIEGYEVDAETTIVSKTASFNVNSAGINAYYVLDKMSKTAEVSVSFSKVKFNGTLAPLVTGDSLLTVIFRDNSLNKCIGKGSACLGKFAYGADIDTSKMSTGEIALTYLYKHATNSYALATPYGNNYPAFNLNEDAYVGFKHTGADKKVFYGWLEVQCGANAVTIKSYGYRAFDLPKAGK